MNPIVLRPCKYVRFAGEDGVNRFDQGGCRARLAIESVLDQLRGNGNAHFGPKLGELRPIVLFLVRVAAILVRMHLNVMLVVA